jgi:hypothetical protein
MTSGQGEYLDIYLWHLSINIGIAVVMLLLFNQEVWISFRNHRGPSHGIYFYRMISGDSAAVQRFVVIE